MTARSDSPVISTFAHTRKMSEPSTTLDSIPELPQSQTLHHHRTHLYSPTNRSPNTPKWNRYNTFFYGPSVDSQRIFSASSAPTPIVKRRSSIVSMPLLSAENDEESDGEDWNQGCDIMSVEEMPWNRCKLPHIRHSDFPYYPQMERAQPLSRFSDDSDSEAAESVAKSGKDAVVVKRAVKEKTGLGKWCKRVLRKLGFTARK